MIVEATPFVVEKLIASVSGVHSRSRCRSAKPVHRSTTVSPRSRTASAPPPARLPTIRRKASVTGSKPGAVVPDRRTGARLAGFGRQLPCQRDVRPAVAAANQHEGGGQAEHRE